MKKLTLLAVAVSAPLWAADDAPKLNPVVEKAMAAALADAEKGYDSYRAILAKATDKAVKDLEKAKTDAMKKGDLASANELEAKVKELKEGGLEKLVMERKIDAGDLLGDGSGRPSGAVLTLWNQNNGGIKDRGSKEVNVSFFRGTQLVRSTGPIEIPWSGGPEERLDIALPRDLLFNRVRVNVVSWHGLGGGMSEIQIIRSGKNIIEGWKASASAAYGTSYDATRVIDGITSSARHGNGYWLLPNNTAGWIEVAAP